MSLLLVVLGKLSVRIHNKHGTSGIWQKNLWVVDCWPVRLFCYFFGSDCITSGRSSHHDVVNLINTYTVAMVSKSCSPYTSPFEVCMKLSSADNLFSGTLLLMPYRSEVVSHPPWHLRKARSAWNRRGPMSSWHLWIFQTFVPLLLSLLRSGTR